MFERKQWAVVVSAAVGVFVVFSLVLAGAPDAAYAASGLADSDCVKCHEKPPADIQAAGGKHKTEVGCQDCHDGHPPTVKKPIPQCSQCHDGEPHFELQNCLACHSNPHQPKNIVLAKGLTKPCLTCHTDQNEQLTRYKSKHSTKACTFCHDKHGKKPACVQCHKPHSSDMGATACGDCHKAHMPKLVTYKDQTPSKHCGACHKQPYAQLAATSTKHGKLLCSKCHVTQHKAMPTCQGCHDVPHPAGIMAKFPVCNDCHKIAHDLNNWGGTASPAPDKAAKPARAVKPKKPVKKTR